MKLEEKFKKKLKNSQVRLAQHIKSHIKNVGKEFNKSKSKNEIQNANKNKLMTLQSEVVLASELKDHYTIEFEKEFPNTEDSDADIYLKEDDVYIEVITPDSVEFKHDEVTATKLSDRRLFLDRITDKIKISEEDYKNINRYYIAVDVYRDQSAESEILITPPKNTIKNVCPSMEYLEGIILYNSAAKNPIEKIVGDSDRIIEFGRSIGLENEETYGDISHNWENMMCLNNSSVSRPDTIIVRHIVDTGYWNISHTNKSIDITKDNLREALNKVKEIRGTSRDGSLIHNNKTPVRVDPPNSERKDRKSLHIFEELSGERINWVVNRINEMIN